MVNSKDLQKYSLFGGLSAEQIDLIRPLLGQEGYAAGEQIMVEGERNDRIRFILEGRVAVVKEGTVLVEMGEGETFGEMEVLDIMPAAATVRALVPTVVATVSNRALREMNKIDQAIFALVIMNLARDLSRRLRHMDELACKDKTRGN